VFSSLRFRLPAFFLAGVVIAGLISTVVASRLFQQHIRSQNLSQLKREARGLTELYAQQAIRSSDEGRSAPDFAAAELEKATGARLFYVGVPIFPGQASGLRELPQSAVDWDALQDGKVITFDFTPPGEHKSFLAVGQPLQLAGGKSPTFGGLIVAKPKTELTHGWIALVELLFVALGIGLVVSTILAWYLSRRIADPVLALAKAADQVAEGKYDIEVPAAGSDEVGHLAERFKQMAARLAEAEEQERNFLMSVSHELRTPLTAIRGHADALREGVVEDPESRAASLDVIAAEADRLERLVGDVLDLAKLDAHRFTLLKEEVDMARLGD
jgi:HAMP domain-containing protein